MSAMRVEDAAAFRDAAVADGWKIKPTYGHEPQHSAATLERDGWHMSVLTRTDSKFLVGPSSVGSVSLWGPDKMHVKTPDAYSMEALKKGLRNCDHCERKNVDTFQVAFAGRCCAECLPEQKKIQEWVSAASSWCS